MSLLVKEADAPADEWVSARAAARLVGLPEKRIRQAADLGHLAIQRPPEGLGGIVKYGRASCLALAASMVTPAKTPPAEGSRPSASSSPAPWPPPHAR